LGPELITNGTFDTDISGWIVVPGNESYTNAYHVTTGDGEMQIKSTPAGAFAGEAARMTQEVTGLTIGEKYTFSFEAGTPAGGNNFVHVGTTIGGVDIAVNMGLGVAGIHTITFVATTTSVWVQLGVTTGGQWNYDNVSVKGNIGGEVFGFTRLEADNMQKAGIVTGLTNITIIIYTTSGGTLPSANDYILFSKNQTINTSSLLGYYADIKLENNSKRKVEIFSLGSEVTESSK